MRQHFSARFRFFFLNSLFLHLYYSGPQHLLRFWECTVSATRILRTIQRRNWTCWWWKTFFMGERWHRYINLKKKPLNLQLITDLTLVFQKNCVRQFGSFYAHIYGPLNCFCAGVWPEGIPEEQEREDGSGKGELWGGAPRWESFETGAWQSPLYSLPLQGHSACCHPQRRPLPVQPPHHWLFLTGGPWWCHGWASRGDHRWENVMLL